jgi:hypothetical protein
MHLSAPALEGGAYQKGMLTVLSVTVIVKQGRVLPLNAMYVNTARGEHIPPLSLHNDIRLAPMYGTPHTRLWEHRKQSVFEFYLPSRLPLHSPQ